MDENRKDDIIRPTENDTTSNIGSEYTVEERDTIEDIERKLNISWTDLAAANKDLFKDGEVIKAGLRLKIPSKQ